MGADSRRAKIGLTPLLSGTDAAAADLYTIRTQGVSGNDLMEKAGLAIAHVIANDLSDRESPVVVICGPGNNGGDGWVIARRLWQNGYKTAVLSLIAPNDLKGEAQIAARQFLSAARNELWLLPNLDSPVQIIREANDVSRTLELLKPALIIDALFGTGLNKPVTGIYASVIDALNAHRTRILAVDIPSGLPCDGQKWEGAHVRADQTIAIQHRKITHASGPYWPHCGEVRVVDIGIVLGASPTAFFLPASKQPPLALLRAPQQHFYKGDYGHVAVLAGALEMQGASQLCAYAALRTGAGLVTRLFAQGTPIFLTIPEVMNRHMPLALDRFTSFVVGPGLDATGLESARAILDFAYAHKRSSVVDAGALPLVKATPPSGPIIATPHPGEAARLLNMTARQVEANRIEAARSLLLLSSTWPSDITWVLKGACPIVAHREHGIVVMEGGLSPLAVAGSGDVLAGLCAALFVQTASSFDAALLGVATHLQAGRNLLSHHARGFLAHEIADEIPRLLF